jgi:hypothetical protein
MSAEEVADAVKMMFDTRLSDQGNVVPAPFSSENLPPEVKFCTTSDCFYF